MPRIAIGDRGFNFTQGLGLEVLRCDGLDEGLVSMGGLAVADNTKTFSFENYGRLALQFWNWYFVDLPISGAMSAFKRKGFPKGVDFLVEEAGLISNRDFTLADDDWRVVLVGIRRGMPNTAQGQVDTLDVEEVARFDRGEEVWRVDLEEARRAAFPDVSSWILPYDSGARLQLRVVDALVLVRKDTFLMAFSLEDGSLKWFHEVGGGVVAAAGSTPDERSIVLLNATSAEFFSAQNGASLGQIEYPPILPETVHQDGSGFYVARDGSGTLHPERGESEPSLWHWDDPHVITASIRGVRRTPR